MKRFLLWIISVALGVVVLLAAVMGVSYAFTTEGAARTGQRSSAGRRWSRTAPAGRCRCWAGSWIRYLPAPPP